MRANCTNTVREPVREQRNAPVWIQGKQGSGYGTNTYTQHTAQICSQRQQKNHNEPSSQLRSLLFTPTGAATGWKAFYSPIEKLSSKRR